MAETARPNILRRMYHWVLSWADRPEGPLALFLISFAESSVFPIPPDPLLMALCLGAITKSLRFAAICTAASVLGGIAGYAIGVFGFEAVGRPVLDAYGKMDSFEELAASFRQEGNLAVLIAAITPVPYKLVTITAGAVRMDLAAFIGASIVGRGLRFFAVAGLLRWKGDAIAEFIEKRFELLAVAFTILLVGGVIAVRAFAH